MSRPAMRFVPVKTAGQQAALMMAGLRGRLIRNRTQQSNAIRGYAAEFGFTAARGMAHIDPLLDRIQADPKVAWVFGTRIAETILASVHVRARNRTYGRKRSDQSTAQITLRGGSRLHMDCIPRLTAAPAVERGAEFQAIGLTKGGYNSKIHAIVDEFLRPCVLILTPGNTADCIMAQECVSFIPGIKELLADSFGGLRRQMPGRGRNRAKNR